MLYCTGVIIICQLLIKQEITQVCMGKIYKDKKSKGCALCKPHKHGWAPKKKAKMLAFERETDKEIIKSLGKQG